MLLRSPFIFAILLAAHLAQGNSCKSIFSPYEVPPGFAQSKYDETLRLLTESGNLFVDLKHTNPQSETTQQEKAHLVALIVAADLSLESSGVLSQWSQHLPLRQRKTFEELALLLISAKSGNINEIYDYLTGLLHDKKYEMWFEFVSKMHSFGNQLPAIDSTSNAEVPVTQSIHDFFAHLGLVVDFDRKTIFSKRFTQPLPWLSKRSLMIHFEKRTKKDGYPMTHEHELVDAANRFILSARTHQTAFQRSDGTLAIYDNRTKELAIVSSDNRIITYYILSSRYSKPEDLAPYMKYVFTEPPKRN